MLVLSKLTNINHANGGSYDPPLFLYSALFPARGRFGGASPHGGGLWWGFPARRRALAGLPRAAAGFGGASPHGGGLWRGFPARRRALPWLPRTAAALAGLPRTAFSAAAVHSAWGGQFFRCFSHTRPAYGKSIRKNFAGYIAVFYIAEENSRSLLR